MRKNDSIGAIGRTFCNVAHSRRFTHTASEDIFEHQDLITVKLFALKRICNLLSAPSVVGMLECL